MITVEHVSEDAMDDRTAREIAQRAAFRAGRLALARSGQPGYLKWRGRRDVIVGAALEVQEMLLSVLREECPGDAILTEEGPEDEPIDVNAERLWIVDPICGSLNFAMGIPFFAISLALRIRGDLQAYYTMQARPWDVAAAGVIVRQAGGQITDGEGGSWLHSDGSYVAADAVSHQWALKIIKTVKEQK